MLTEIETAVADVFAELMMPAVWPKPSDPVASRLAFRLMVPAPAKTLLETVRAFCVLIDTFPLTEIGLFSQTAASLGDGDREVPVRGTGGGAEGGAGTATSAYVKVVEPGRR